MDPRRNRAPRGQLSAALRVRHVLAGEHDRLRELRLASLVTDPDAFASTYDRDASRPAQWWERWAAQSEQGTTQRTFVVVDRSGRWQGLALVRHDPDLARSAHLTAMWVAPAVRRRRAAASLCDACAAWARAHGCRELTLNVVVGNRPARRAYEAAGFAIRETTTWSQDGRVLDELLMARSL